ncbi:glycoside hydrolase [Flammeovirgaceae bacterium 311]|nr:glycoside hydrolase [Flammeovirgaceae bacterium 311]
MGRFNTQVFPDVVDAKGQTVTRADHPITFEISGPGKIESTDNGDPTIFLPFTSHEREAFNGLALVVIRSRVKDGDKIKATAKSDGLKDAQIVVNSQ